LEKITKGGAIRKTHPLQQIQLILLMVSTQLIKKVCSSNWIPFPQMFEAFFPQEKKSGTFIADFLTCEETKHLSGPLADP